MFGRLHKISSKDKDVLLYEGQNLWVWLRGTTYKESVPSFLRFVDRLKLPYGSNTHQVFTLDFRDGNILKEVIYRDAGHKNDTFILSTTEVIPVSVDHENGIIKVDESKRNPALNIVGMMHRVKNQKPWHAARDSKRVTIDTKLIPDRVLSLRKILEKALDQYIKDHRIRGDVTAIYRMKEMSPKRNSKDQIRKKSLTIQIGAPYAYGSSAHFYVFYQKVNGELVPVGFEDRDSGKSFMTGSPHTLPDIPRKLPPIPSAQKTSLPPIPRNKKK